MTQVAKCRYACVAGVLALLCTASLSAQTMTLRVGALSAASGSTVNVPIDVSGASKVGALQFELLYNPELLTAETARAGALASNSLFDVKTDRPGRLFIALVTTDGITGDGTVATASFKVTGMSGATVSLTPESALAWEGVTLREVQVTPVAGVLTITGPGFPWLWILVALAVLVLLFLVFFLARRSRRDSKSAAVPAPAQAARSTSPGGGSFCPHCGQANPADSKFCASCGKRFD